VKAFNPLSRPDNQLFAALMSGEHTLHGFANRDLRDKLAASVLHLHDEPKKASSQVSRLLHRLHVHGLVAKIPRSRRWRVTAFGHSVMGTALKLRQRDFPSLYPVAA
jgi:DNA-binding IclR family transcriptional regulator